MFFGIFLYFKMIENIILYKITFFLKLFYNFNDHNK